MAKLRLQVSDRQLAEAAVTRNLFEAILARITRLAIPPLRINNPGGREYRGKFGMHWTREGMRPVIMSGIQSLKRSRLNPNGKYRSARKAAW